MDQAIELVEGKYKTCRAIFAYKGHGIYFCPECGEPVYKRSGKSNVAHFAHEKNSSCNGGYEGTYSEMSAWHKKWQDRFPEECREIWEKDLQTGKCHRADVLIGNKVIEFQHSNISKDKFKERTSFWLNKGYEVIWLFDGKDYNFRCREIEDDCFVACYSSNSVFEEFKKEDFLPGLSIFIEGNLPTGKRNVIFEKGFNIFRVESIIGTSKGYAAINFDKNNLHAYYNKTRFLLFCGVDRISKSYSIEEIVSHYSESSEIAIYNHKSGIVKIVNADDNVSCDDSNWFPIYHSQSERLLKELEERRRKNIEEYDRKVKELRISTRETILNYINKIECLYRERFEEGFAANNKPPRGVYDTKYAIREELKKYNDLQTVFRFYNLLDRYDKVLDGYYLAMHRNLPGFVASKEKELKDIKNEMLEIVNNLSINHL